MPVVNIASSLGQAGDAVAPVTAQINANMGMMLQLAQLQDQRTQRRQMLEQRQREFSAQMGAQDFTQQARLREEERQAKLDDAQLERVVSDREYRDKVFAFEQSARLTDQERQAAQTDSEIAAREASTGAALSRQQLAERGVASQTSALLGGKYQVSSDGLLSMLSELYKYDQENGTSYADAADSALHQITGGDYADMAPATLTAELGRDPRLAQAFAVVGEQLYSIKKQERTKQLATEVTRAYGSLAKRVEAIGDKQMLEELNQSITRLVPQDNDESFLDYGDGGNFGKDIAAWNQRVGLAESRHGARGAMEALRAKVPADSWSAMIGSGTKTKAEVFGEALGQIEAAENPAEVSAALVQVRAALEPGAADLLDFGWRQANASFGSPRAGSNSIQASSKFMGGGSWTPRQAEIAREVMDHLGFMEFPAAGTEEDATLKSAIRDALAQEQQRNQSVQPARTTELGSDMRSTAIPGESPVQRAERRSLAKLRGIPFIE